MVKLNEPENIDNSPEVIAEAKHALDLHAKNISPETMTKLAAIRERVSDQVERQSNWDLRWNKLSYIPALAACLLVVVVLFNQPSDPLQDGFGPSDIELVLVNEDFDVLQEELAFYEWLDQESTSS